MNEWPERWKNMALRWIKDQWNRPDQTHYYLMRIAQRIQQQWSKNTGQITLEGQRIRWNVDDAPKKTLEERVAESKAVWIGGVKAAQEARGRGHRT
jgi:hypothetical protein